MKEIEIQDSFFEDPYQNDLVYAGLKRIEKKELTMNLRVYLNLFRIII